MASPNEMGQPISGFIIELVDEVVDELVDEVAERANFTPLPVANLAAFLTVSRWSQSLLVDINSDFVECDTFLKAGTTNQLGEGSCREHTGD